MTEGYLRFNLGGSVRRLSQLRSEQLAKMKETKVRRIRQLLADTESGGEVSSQRKTVRRVATKAGSSVSLVRRLVHAEKIGHVTIRNEVEASFNCSTLSSPEELRLSELLQERGWMKALQACQLLFPEVRGKSPKYKLDYLVHSRQILFVKYRDKYIYPKSQFDMSKRCVRKSVIDILKRLPESVDGRREVLWFYTPNPNLGGLPPIDYLEHDISAVMSLADLLEDGLTERHSCGDD